MTLNKFSKLLKWIRDKYSWYYGRKHLKNPKVKYINLTIDTRDMNVFYVKFYGGSSEQEFLHTNEWRFNDLELDIKNFLERNAQPKPNNESLPF